MNKSWQFKRVFVYTLIALLSGILSAYIGSQISLQIHRQKCQNQPWGFRTVCHTWVAPGAIWQGGTTGFGIGAILGGLAAWATFKKVGCHRQNAEPLIFALQANELELTSKQREVLRRLLMLVVLKLASQTASDAESNSVSLTELQQLLAIAKQQRLMSKDFTLADADQLIKTLGADQPPEIRSQTDISPKPLHSQNQ